MVGYSAYIDRRIHLFASGYSDFASTVERDAFCANFTTFRAVITSFPAFPYWYTTYSLKDCVVFHTTQPAITTGNLLPSLYTIQALLAGSYVQPPTCGIIL